METNNTEQPMCMLGKLFNTKTGLYGKPFLLCTDHLVQQRSRWQIEGLKFTQTGRVRGICRFCEKKKEVRVLRDIKVTSVNLEKEPINKLQTTKVVNREVQNEQAASKPTQTEQGQ